MRYVLVYYGLSYTVYVGGGLPTTNFLDARVFPTKEEAEQVETSAYKAVPYEAELHRLKLIGSGNAY